MTRRLIVVAVAVCLLAGCALGARPTLTTERKVDDAAIGAVLDLLGAAGATPFTATYNITPALAGSTPVPATVRHDASRTRVTIGAVEYADVDGEQRTCQSGLVECVAGYDEARISDLAVTSAFWGTSAALRLSTDAGRNIADATGTTETIAGQPTTCAALTLTNGTSTYCALATGPLARYLGADVTIELTSYSPQVDPAAFG